MSVDVVTFGCRLNIHESDVIRRNAMRAGLSDVVVVNTCAVTGEAVSQARQTIRKIFRERGDARPSSSPAARRRPIRKCSRRCRKSRASSATTTSCSEQHGRHARGARSRRRRRGQDRGLRHHDADATPARAALEGHDGRTRAFLQIQNGCDHRCTFCIIPFGRGNSRSVAPEDVVAQARGLVAQGFREIVLTGVDLTSYGEHLPGAPKLGALVKRILKDVPELARLRLSSIDAVEADRDLIDAFASDARLMPHLHLSLAGRRRHDPQAHEAASLAAPTPSRSANRCGGCGPTSCSAPTSSPAFRPRPRTCSRARSISSTNAASPICTCFRSRRVPARRRRACRRCAAMSSRSARGGCAQCGAAALRRHLDGEIGATRRVLTERGNTGRTEQFTQVRFNAPVEAGQLIDVDRRGARRHDH